MANIKMGTILALFCLTLHNFVQISMCCTPCVKFNMTTTTLSTYSASTPTISGSSALASEASSASVETSSSTSTTKAPAKRRKREMANGPEKRQRRQLNDGPKGPFGQFAGGQSEQENGSRLPFPSSYPWPHFPLFGLIPRPCISKWPFRFFHGPHRHPSNGSANATTTEMPAVAASNGTTPKINTTVKPATKAAITASSSYSSSSSSSRPFSSFSSSSPPSSSPSSSSSSHSPSYASSSPSTLSSSKSSNSSSPPSPPSSSISSTANSSASSPTKSPIGRGKRSASASITIGSSSSTPGNGSVLILLNTTTPILLSNEDVEKLISEMTGPIPFPKHHSFARANDGKIAVVVELDEAEEYCLQIKQYMQEFVQKLKTLGIGAEAEVKCQEE